MYVLHVAENSHYADERDASRRGDFATRLDAVQGARKIVDRSLVELFRSGMTSDALFTAYTTFGEEPFIIPAQSDERFSAWDYARERCEALCNPR